MGRYIYIIVLSLIVVLQARKEKAIFPDGKQISLQIRMGGLFGDEEKEELDYLLRHGLLSASIIRRLPSEPPMRIESEPDDKWEW